MTNRARNIWVSAGLAVAVGLWIVVIGPEFRSHRLRAEVMRSLCSSESEIRKRGAWAAIEQPDAALVAILIRGLSGDEPDENVREAYAYTLGKIGDPAGFAAIEAAIDSDPSGYVRAAAWLAAARSAPDRFGALADARQRSERSWELLGVAQGRLLLCDVSGVGDLLEFAGNDNAAQRQVASRALFKWLRPILDSAGRWPVDATIREGEVWPPELVSEIARRCAALDLRGVAEGYCRQRAAAERVRRNVLRITRARDSLAGLLFAR